MKWIAILIQLLSNNYLDEWLKQMCSVNLTVGLADYCKLIEKDINKF